MCAGVRAEIWLYSRKLRHPLHALVSQIIKKTKTDNNVRALLFSKNSVASGHNINGWPLAINDFFLRDLIPKRHILQ